MTGAYFITATGTDIGKTFVTSLLIRHFRDERRAVKACKPLMSGVGEDICATDAGLLLNALGEEVTAKTIAAISPWQFAAPLSPHRASALEGVALSLTEVTGWCEAWLAAHAASLRLIEGVGGVMVPLNNTSTTLDLMRALSLPALLVCGDYLGTYSHSLTAMAALNTANVPIRGMIVNQSETGVEHYETIASLRSFTSGRIPVVSLPRIPRLRESNDAFKEMREHPDFQDFFSFADSL